MKNYALPLLFALTMAAITATPFIGGAQLDFGAADGAARQIFMELRVPRVLLAWITGATLSVCGLIYQALFRNSLASPDMLGISTGAAFGAVLYIRAGFVFSFFGIFSGLSAAAFAGALLATAAIYMAGSARRWGMSEASLLLSGIAMSFLFGSLTMIIQYSGGYTDTFRMMRWTMGGVQAVGYSPVLAVLPSLILVFLIALTASSELDLLAAGENVAESRGVSVAGLRARLFLVVSLAVGVCVAVCGPIGFVGLMVPHICRKLTGVQHRRLVFACVLFGGALLVICDTAARTLWSPAEVPVGVLTSCVGSVFFLWLLIRK